MKKQKIKGSFLGLRADDYFILRDNYMMRHEDIVVLSCNPRKFFSEFKKYSKTVPESLKQECYSFCFDVAMNRADNYEKFFLVSQNQQNQKQKKGGERKMKALSSILAVTVMFLFFLISPVLAAEEEKESFAHCTFFLNDVEGKWSVEQKDFTALDEAMAEIDKTVANKKRVLADCYFTNDDRRIDRFTLDITAHGK